MGIFSFIILLVLSFIFLWKMKGKTALSTKQIFIGWSIKICFSFLFILIFRDFYGDGYLAGDAYNFINDGKLLYEFGIENPLEYLKMLFGFADNSILLQDSLLQQTNIWSAGENGDLINDNRLIIRINSLIHFISFGNYYVHALVLSFLSYIGILLLYRTFKNYISNKKLFFFLLVAFPSIGFWGSGITKEAILIFGMGLFFYGLFIGLTKKSTKAILYFLVGIFILLLNKPHVGIIIVGLSPIFMIGEITKWKKLVLVLFPFMVLLGIVVLTYTPSKINLLEKVSYKQRDLINMGEGGIFFITDSSFCSFDFQYFQHFKQESDKKITVLKETTGEYKLFGEKTFHPFIMPKSNVQYDLYLIQKPSDSYIPVTAIAYSRKRLFMNIPSVFINTLLRPYPWDPGSNLKFLAIGSNLFFLFLIGFSVFNRKKLGKKEKYILWYFVISALLILLLIGWTTPILGAIVRYKVAVELLLLIGLSLILKPLKKQHI